MKLDNRNLRPEQIVALADALAQIPGVEIVTPNFFNEFTIKTPKPSGWVIERLVDRSVIGGVPGARLWPEEAGLANLIVVAATEMTTEDDIAAYKAALSEVLHG